MTAFNSVKMLLMISTMTQFFKVFFVFDFFNPCLNAMNDTAQIAIRALLNVLYFDLMCNATIVFHHKKNYRIK